MTRHGPSDDDLHAATLANGVRVITLRVPRRQTASVSVFVRSGSQHESRRRNGISHVVEHMAFKGTTERDCQRINLDAERLGAEVNAHTDKDHTAFHMEGRTRDVSAFIEMLGDIVLNSSFPQAELERERQVILHELVEDEEDALSAAYKLFDKASFGDHAFAQAVIGQRRNIERFSRDDLLDHVQRHYTASNVIVGVAGDIEPASIIDRVQAVFGGLRRDADNRVAPAPYLGGIKTQRLSGCAQTHLVLGFPMPTLTGDYHAHVVAAALFGEGMSSPLLDEIRERRGLVYYAACSADVMELGGQFVIEASTAPAQVDEFFVEVMRLLARQVERIDPVDLDRARNQLAVRGLRDQERPARRLEYAAEDLFVHGRVSSIAQRLARIEAVTAEQVRSAFEQMLSAPASVALAGKVASGAADRVMDRVTAGR
jgi:predicted Zn-dependent peptidase